MQHFLESLFGQTVLKSFQQIGEEVSYAVYKFDSGIRVPEFETGSCTN